MEDDSLVQDKPGWGGHQVFSDEESPEISVVQETPLSPPTRISPEFSPAEQKRPKFFPPQLDPELFSDEESSEEETRFK